MVTAVLMTIMMSMSMPVRVDGKSCCIGYCSPINFAQQDGQRWLQDLLQWILFPLKLSAVGVALVLARVAELDTLPL